MTRANTCSLFGDHSAVRIDEFLQNIDVFVVDVSDVVLSKEALFHGFFLLFYDYLLILNALERLERDVFWVDVL